ncbi:hypothetical protein Scep_004425 [Stephania cephalantha]|uniref:Uncharacterized protein n=1 Tax=Stephania cephalantha TaxID=152367 RepID=A0AAP0KSG0_9MAGN
MVHFEMDLALFVECVEIHCFESVSRLSEDPKETTRGGPDRNFPKLGLGIGQQRLR